MTVCLDIQTVSQIKVQTIKNHEKKNLKTPGETLVREGILPCQSLQRIITLCQSVIACQVHENPLP